MGRTFSEFSSLSTNRRLERRSNGPFESIWTHLCGRWLVGRESQNVSFGKVDPYYIGTLANMRRQRELEELQRDFIEKLDLVCDMAPMDSSSTTDKGVINEAVPQ